jgi:hypothetical protein
MVTTASPSAPRRADVEQQERTAPEVGGDRRILKRRHRAIVATGRQAPLAFCAACGGGHCEKLRFVALRAQPVDPRDVTIEESEPTYRVYFWSDDGRRCREYDVTGADAVDDVIGWADANVLRGEIYILGVRWQESLTPSGAEGPHVVFVRLKGDPPPGQSVGHRRG